MADEIEHRTSTGYLQALFTLLRKWTPYSSSVAGSDAREGSAKETRTSAPSQKRRVIIRAEEEAADGQVAAVQAALRNGWRLIDIELRTETEERRLAFVLHRRPQTGPSAKR